MNAQFGTDFGVFDHTAANVARIREGKGYHALPGARRERLKERVRRDFERMLEDASARRLLGEAEALYRWHEARAAVAARQRRAERTP